MDKIVLQITRNGKPVKQFKCPNRKMLAKHFMHVYGVADAMRADGDGGDIKVCVFTKSTETPAQTDAPAQAPSTAPTKAPAAPTVPEPTAAKPRV